MDNLANGAVIRAAIQAHGKDAVTNLLAGGFRFKFDFDEGSGGRVLSPKSVQRFYRLLAESEASKGKGAKNGN